MSRSKKTEEKAKESITLTVDVDQFVRTRDTVLEGLANLQDCLKGLASQYMQHTNYVLGEHAGAFDAVAVMAKLTENSVLGSTAGSSAPQRAASAEKSTGKAAADDKSQRKKRQHDPDAPKRPLTPFFLYMQTARPIIAGDLGPEAAKGAVSNEGTLRWSNMDKESKLLWTAAYKENLRLYNARMHYYRLGNKDAKNMTDAEAATYAEENNLGDAGADAQLVGEASANHLEEDAEGEAEPEKEPTPPPAPVKTPKAKGRKGKATKSAAVVEEPVEEEVVAPTPVASSSIVPPKSAEKETPKSPDKKRKRVSKKGVVEEPVATPAKEELAVETPTAKSASKPRKKKAKADA